MVRLKRFRCRFRGHHEHLRIAATKLVIAYCWRCEQMISYD